MDGETVETLPIKVGPWGGSRGDPFDITEEPKRLESMTARVGAFVSSFGFSYADPAGRKHTVGPVGGNAGKLITIQFEPTEYVKEFSGSLGPTQGSWIVTYLRIETNLKSYELYDEVTELFPSLPGSVVPIMLQREIPFSLPVPENTSIVGFFGRAGGDSLDAIGVYVKSTSTNTAQETGTYQLDDYASDEPIFMVAEAVPIKTGAWGGDGGTEFDVTEPPKRLESITVRAGDSVDSIGFSYADEQGQKHSVGPFGGTDRVCIIASEEYVKKLSGTIGCSGGMSFVASLDIETNIRTYGPYGKTHKDYYPFSVPLPENVSIVGFFGRAGRLLDAVGVYIGYSRSPFTDATEEASADKDEAASKDKATASQESKTITDEQTFPIKIGTWGLGEGMEFDVTEPPKRLESVMIQAGDIIDSFGFSYTDQAGKKHTVGPYGGSGGSLTTIQLEPTEYLKHFSGTTGTYVGSPVVASLKIETNLRVYGPYGRIPLHNASVVGFFGFTDNLLGAIGVYVGGSIPN